MGISKIEIGACLSFFNQGGYVLELQAQMNLNNFTGEVVGVFVCSKYKMSKGKSLTAYANDAPENDLIKLFAALMQHYKLSTEIERDREYKAERDLVNIKNAKPLLTKPRMVTSIL